MEIEKHYDYNFEHFYEEYVYSKYDISYDTMLKRFTKDDIISPLAHKKTVIKKDNYDEKEKQIELFKSRIIEAEKTHPRRSSNLYVFGQEVQMDACNKMWFGGISTFLHLAVDKATKKVLFGWFEYEEITRGYFVVLFNMILNYGIPAKIKADNRSTFSANNAKEKDNKYYVSVVFEEKLENKEIIPNKIIGLDLGIKDLVITSDGKKYNNEKVIEKYEKRIKIKQRQLSKKTKGSNNYYKTKQQLTRLYTKIKNARNYANNQFW